MPGFLTIEGPASFRSLLGKRYSSWRRVENRMMSRQPVISLIFGKFSFFVCMSMYTLSRVSIFNTQKKTKLPINFMRLVCHVWFHFYTTIQICFLFIGRSIES